MYIIFPESDDLDILYLMEDEHADGEWIKNYPAYVDDNYQIEVETDE